MTENREQEPDENAQEPAVPAEAESATWTLVRDVAVLQVKLLVDGFRDLLLVPASLIAGGLSLARRQGGRPGPEFYRLLAVGKQSENWINLFGALEHSPESADTEAPDAADIDEIVARFEGFVVDEYRRGGLTKQARERIDRAIESLRRHAG
ncbi:MAG: hypothetical protein R3176_08040 [Woeseiaceae bacterium]|nr:hypothetical protein [Woeseiaceae bacterium]